MANTPAEADDAELVPYGLVDTTVYVYVVFEDNPVTVIGLDDPVNVDGDVVGDGVTVKELGAPPLEFGVNATDICPLLNVLPDP